ncbi:MAG: RecX family transcriptional regulator [Balneola sp.]
MSYSIKTYSKQEPDLPVTIHRIEVQKKNTFRYSLFSKEGFITGVSDSTLTKHNLRKGSVLDTELYKAISLEEERWSIREYLMRLLGRRDHASHELKLKGIKKGYDSGILDEIISELEAKDYINNYGFAKKYVRDKFRFNDWGPNKIRTQLISKKINKKIIEHVLDEEIQQDDVLDSIRNLIDKKKPSLLRTDKKKRKKKIFDYLIRKGYDSNVILKEIDGLLELVNT